MKNKGSSEGNRGSKQVLDVVPDKVAGECSLTFYIRNQMCLINNEEAKKTYSVLL